MISVLIDCFIFYYIVFPLAIYAWFSFTSLFRKKEVYIEPVKPYTIDHWLYGKQS